MGSLGISPGRYNTVITTANTFLVIYTLLYRTVSLFILSFCNEKLYSGLPVISYSIISSIFVTGL